MWAKLSRWWWWWFYARWFRESMDKFNARLLSEEPIACRIGRDIFVPRLKWNFISSTRRIVDPGRTMRLLTEETYNARFELSLMVALPWGWSSYTVGFGCKSEQILPKTVRHFPTDVCCQLSTMPKKYSACYSLRLPWLNTKKSHTQDVMAELKTCINHNNLAKFINWAFESLDKSRGSCWRFSGVECIHVRAQLVFLPLPAPRETHQHVDIASISFSLFLSHSLHL